MSMHQEWSHGDIPANLEFPVQEFFGNNLQSVTLSPNTSTNYTMISVVPPWDGPMFVEAAISAHFNSGGVQAAYVSVDCTADPPDKAPTSEDYRSEGASSSNGAVWVAPVWGYWYQAVGGDTYAIHLNVACGTGGPSLTIIESWASVRCYYGFLPQI